MKKYFKYFIFILVTNLSIFFAAELLLHIFNLFPPHRFFVEAKDDQGRVWVEYPGSPNKPKFLKNKPIGAFRILSFGESTTMGYPYYPRSSFSRMLEKSLNQSGPEKEVEVINLGLSGMTSLEILHCLRESLKYQPDLAIIYAGQNEFFQASLFADWKHPLIDRTMDLLRLHSRIYQMLSRADKLLLIIPAAIGTHQEIVEKLNMDMELPMENRPISKKFYDDRVQGYRYHMEKILGTLHEHRVPALICTVVVNLKDWPPEWLPFPHNLSNRQSEQLKSNLYAAYLDIADGQTAQAASFLEKSKPLANDYAMFYFVQARLEEKQGKYDLAKANFLLARKFDNSRHRAPPEINQILRDLAPQYQATLIDIDRLFAESAATTPGFDLFVDHVHPNLTGQRLIAQELYKNLAGSQMVGVRKPLEQIPSVDQFKNEFKLDDEFISGVNLRLAIYYLLQRRLPDHDRQTISCLEQVIAKDPQNVLAEICLAAVLLSNHQNDQAMQILVSCLKANGKDLVHRILQHYFFPKLIMEGDYLLVHLNIDPAMPLMRGIILVRSQPGKTGARPVLPLDQYGWIFRFLPQANKIENVTDSLLKEYKSKKELCSRPQTAEMDIVQYFREKPQLFLANEAVLHAKTLGLTIDMTGNDPWFAFPIEPGFFAGKIELEIAIDPGDKKIRRDNLGFYWSESKTPEFSEDRKISVPVNLDGRVQTININLSENINWVDSKSISALRVDPANSPGHARIKKFRMPLCGIAPTQ